jgi:hypothetical protein
VEAVIFIGLQGSGKILRSAKALQPPFLEEGIDEILTIGATA